MVDLETGLKPNANTKKTIYESFKKEDKFIVNLENLSNKDKLNFYDTEKNKKILKFY